MQTLGGGSARALSNAERNIATLEQRLLQLNESIEAAKPDNDSEQLELLTGQLAQAETMVNNEREAIERLKASVVEHRERGDTLRPSKMSCAERFRC